MKKTRLKELITNTIYLLVLSSTYAIYIVYALMK